MKENYEKIKQEKDQVSKTKNQIEKSLKDVGSKSGAEITTLQAQLDEALQKNKTLQFKIDEMKSQLAELENERANHQKLIKEYSKLEQRFEKVRTELLKYSKNQQMQQQQQQSSNNLVPGSMSASTVSFPGQHTSELESLIEELEQDTKLKINTTSSTANEITNGVANFEANKLLYMTANGAEMDVSLISKLNRRIAALELERKDFLRSGTSKANLLSNEQDNNNNINDLNELNNSPNVVIEKLQQEKDYEMIKSQEMELENQKLREDLSRLRDLTFDNQNGKSDTIINKEMMSQFDALNEEVQRRREECVQLKTLLVAKHRATKQLNGSDKSSENEAELADINSINTDGNEFEVGYNTQKYLNRILENQMNEMKRNHENEKLAVQKELKQLKDENERQHNLLMQNLSPESLAEATYKNEIMKLADSNLVSAPF